MLFCLFPQLSRGVRLLLFPLQNSPMEAHKPNSDSVLKMLAPNVVSISLFLYHFSKSSLQVLLFLLPGHIMFQGRAVQGVPLWRPLP